MRHHLQGNLWFCCWRRTTCSSPRCSRNQIQESGKSFPFTYHLVFSVINYLFVWILNETTELTPCFCRIPQRNCRILFQNSEAGVFWGVQTRTQVHKSDFLSTSTGKIEHEGMKEGCDSKSDASLPRGLHMSSHVLFFFSLFKPKELHPLFG